MSIIWAPGRPTMTVMRACGKRARIARSAGRLMTTSPSWPKSMTRILRGLNVTSNAYRKSPRRHDKRAANPDAAESRESHQEKLVPQNKLRLFATGAPNSPSGQTRHCDRRHHESEALVTSIYPPPKLAKTHAQSERDQRCRWVPVARRRSCSNRVLRGNPRPRRRCLSCALISMQSDSLRTIHPTDRLASYL